MKHLFAVLTAVLMGVSFAGCAGVQTKVVEKPRLDQELHGNRGYLKGSNPDNGPRRDTREMFETNVELKTLAEILPWRKRKAAEEEAARKQQAAVTPAPIPAFEPPAQEWQQEPQVEPAYQEPEPQQEREEVSAPAGGSQYTVQKNDTLQKISQKHFGTTKHWYQIFQANKDMLKSPDRIRPGQTIMIPRLAKNTGADRGDNEYK